MRNHIVGVRYRNNSTRMKLDVTGFEHPVMDFLPYYYETNSKKEEVKNTLLCVGIHSAVSMKSSFDFEDPSQVRRC